ncbi:hypothetical protein [Nocardioides sp. Leaf285]|uniref:hypothetical protein n=1 Tax=Nocardioides sp. Leaf285 TaxID=1736322 RepID=UPI000AADF809|nr:hypothetical protein [Nocardioides sp. Leaf285]
MTASPMPSTARSREDARRADGRFGPQSRHEARAVTLIPGAVAPPAPAPYDIEGITWVGTGWGPYVPVRRLRTFAGVETGDLIAEQVPHFRTRRLIRLHRVVPEKGMVLGHYVDPADPHTRQPHANTIDLWTFDLPRNEREGLSAFRELFATDRIDARG